MCVAIVDIAAIATVATFLGGWCVAWVVVALAAPTQPVSSLPPSTFFFVLSPFAGSRGGTRPAEGAAAAGPRHTGNTKAFAGQGERRTYAYQIEWKCGDTSFYFMAQ
eukprot:GHVT01084155.1.p3 GENE.GHVT01084155.1~~GHVT01084155.1.p3  ORF type:complete len:107 (-),score=15.37 GHVT01084155.1:2281-2601(-)